MERTRLTLTALPPAASYLLVPRIEGPIRMSVGINRSEGQTTGRAGKGVAGPASQEACPACSAVWHVVEGWMAQWLRTGTTLPGVLGLIPRTHHCL